MKTCASCQETKPREAFSPHKQSRDGLYSFCKPCAARKSAGYRSRNPEKTNAASKAWRIANPERFAAAQRAYLDANRERLQVISRDRVRGIRAEMIAAYGARCVCCGETEPKFLTIDHINNDGGGGKRKERNIALVLKRLGWPKDNYQLLCFNCNCAKGFYGACPHAEADAALYPDLPTATAVERVCWTH
jgi:hypothetical protein